jgi:L-alanine-DL-glutamate epimerase-like enolase superfamily enzyme
LVGGNVTSLPSYASIPLFDDVQAYLAAIETCMREGFGAVKVHAWGEPERDAALLLAIRRSFPSLTLMHDAEGRYGRDGAAEVARTCVEIGARWFEGPLPGADLDGYRRLRREVPGISILPAGDTVWDARLMADALRDPPWDAVRFDVSFVGGFTPARDLVAIAIDADLPVELISYGHTVIQATNLHAALAFGRTSYFEQAMPPEPFEHGVVHPLRTGPDGCVRAPVGNGLGVELDEGAIEEATLAVIRAGPDG